MFTEEQLHKELKNIMMVTDTCLLCNAIGVNMELFKINKRDYRVSAGGDTFIETAMFASSNSPETSVTKYEPTISVKEFLKVHGLGVEIVQTCMQKLIADGLIYSYPNLADSDMKYLYIPELAKAYTGFKISNTNIVCYCSDSGDVIFIDETKFSPTGLKLDINNLSEYSHKDVFTALYSYVSQRFKYANKFYFVGVDNTIRNKVFDNLKSRCKDGRQIRVTKELNRYLVTYTDMSLDNLKSAGAETVNQRKEHWS